MTHIIKNLQKINQEKYFIQILNETYNLYTKYDLRREVDGYRYYIDEDYSNNVDYLTTKEVEVQLYRIKVQ